MNAESLGFEPSRRDVLLGGLFFGALFLTGCQSGSGGAATDGSRMTQSRPTSAGMPPPYQPPASLPPPGVLSRSSWTSAGVARPREIYPLGPVSRITIHHDGMNAFASTSQSDAARRLEQIRQAHVSGRKWADIGYHYIIDPAGRVWEGRSTAYQGAHVQDNNENNLGVMVLGNFELQRPTPTQTAALDRFVATQMRRFRVPVSRVYTHREIKPTECPGRNLQTYMLATRARGGGLAVALADSGDGSLLA